MRSQMGGLEAIERSLAGLLPSLEGAFDWSETAASTPVVAELMELTHDGERLVEKPRVAG